MTYKDTKKSAPTTARSRAKATPQMQYKNDTTEAIVIQALKGGKAVKRYELAALAGVADVRLRECIASLQMEGQPIINMQDGRGYKFAVTDEELAAYKAQETARAKQILKKVKAMRLEV